MVSRPDVFDLARRDAGLTHGELWLRYFELGRDHPVAYSDAGTPWTE